MAVEGPQDTPYAMDPEADVTGRTAAGWRSPRAGRSGCSRGETAASDAPDTVAMAERIRELAASIHSAEAELVGLLAGFDAVDGWCGHGYRSMEHWLSVNAGFTLAEGRVRARLADRSPELPCLMGALEAGGLSVGAARAASRVATPANDHKVTQIATVATAQQAARTFAAYEAAEDSRRSREPSPPPEADHPDAVEEPNNKSTSNREPRSCWFHTWWDDHGHLCISGRLAPSDGALVRPALDAMRHLADRHDTVEHTEQTTGRISNVEAFARFCRTAMDSANLRGLRDRNGDRYAVHITIDADILTGQRPGHGLLTDNTPIPPDTLRTWMGQATIDALLQHDGQPLWLSREKRVATRAIRRALRARDGNGCAFPGCDQTHWVDAHHVTHWEHGGLTDVDNMVLLCRTHHTKLHNGEYTIHMSRGRPRFDTGEPLTTTTTTASPTSTTTASPRTTATRPAPLGRVAEPARVRRSGEPLTDWALDVLVTTLLDAA